MKFKIHQSCPSMRLRLDSQPSIHTLLVNICFLDSGSLNFIILSAAAKNSSVQKMTLPPTLSDANSGRFVLRFFDIFRHNI